MQHLRDEILGRLSSFVGVLKRKLSVIESLEDQDQFVSPLAKSRRFAPEIDDKCDFIDRPFFVDHQDRSTPDRNRLFSPLELITPTVAEWFYPMQSRSQNRMFSISERKHGHAKVGSAAAHDQCRDSSESNVGPFYSPSGRVSARTNNRRMGFTENGPSTALVLRLKESEYGNHSCCSMTPITESSRKSTSSRLDATPNSPQSVVNRTSPMSDVSANSSFNSPSNSRPLHRCSNDAGRPGTSREPDSSLSPTSQLHLFLRQRRWDRMKKPDVVDLTGDVRVPRGTASRGGRYRPSCSAITWDSVAQKSWMTGDRARGAISKRQRRSHNEFQSTLADCVRLEERDNYKKVLANFFADQAAGCSTLQSNKSCGNGASSADIDVVDITGDEVRDPAHPFNYELGNRIARKLVNDLCDDHGAKTDPAIDVESRSPSLSSLPENESKSVGQPEHSIEKHVPAGSNDSNSPQVVDLEENDIPLLDVGGAELSGAQFGHGVTDRRQQRQHLPSTKKHSHRLDSSDVNSLNEKLYNFSLDREKIEHSINEYKIDARQRHQSAEALETEVKLMENERYRLLARSENEARRRLRISGYIVPEPDVSLEEEVPTYDEFPELSEEQLEFVRKIWSRGGNPDAVIVEAFKIPMTKSDLATLQGSTWLNDEVINFYMNLIAERSKDQENRLHPAGSLPSVHVFSTFFYPKLGKTGHAGVKRWTKNVDIFGVDLILIPIHLGMHWCMATIDLRSKEIKYFDSLGKSNQACLKALRDYLVDELKSKKEEIMDTTEWKLLTPCDIPQQMNGSDCGVFACKFAEYASRDAPQTFGQEHMNYFRRRMVWEICHQQML